MNAFLSLFSGIGGMDLGLEQSGWRCVGQVEIDEYRRGILKRHWPGVSRWGDIRQFDPMGRSSEADSLTGRPSTDAVRGEGRGPTDALCGDPPDLICGGFPCQDLSVAGRRAGFEGARSSLWWEFHRILDAVRPRWCLVENVPGLLSSHKGRDFALLLASLAELGYGVAWRVLDSRYFGVPQRRRRVFIVGCLGGRSSNPFLPFLEGGEGDPAEGGAAGQDVASTLGGGSGKRGWADDFDRSGGFVSQPLRSNPYNNSDPGMEARMHILTGPLAVRRLTPVECCRLQGFPDDWLGPPNEPPDSPKYAALGDAVTVPVASWIGRRLMETG